MGLTFCDFVGRWLPLCATLPAAGSSLLAAAPVVSSALVFQSIVPVVAERLEGDRQRTKRSVFVGSALPMLAYAAFTFAVLGRLSGDDLVYRADGLLDPLQSLPADVADASLFPLVLFSVCAVTTSFVGTALSQRHELAGMLPHLPKAAHDALALVPPALAALWFRGDSSFFVAAIALTGALANPLLFFAFPLGLLLPTRGLASDQDDASVLQLKPHLKRPLTPTLRILLDDATTLLTLGGSSKEQPWSPPMRTTKKAAPFLLSRTARPPPE